MGIEIGEWDCRLGLEIGIWKWDLRDLRLVIDILDFGLKWGLRLGIKIGNVGLGLREWHGRLGLGIGIWVCQW